MKFFFSVSIYIYGKGSIPNAPHEMDGCLMKPPLPLPVVTPTSHIPLARMLVIFCTDLLFLYLSEMDIGYICLKTTSH